MKAKQSTGDGGGLLQLVQVVRERGHVGAHEFAQDGEVDGQSGQVVREVRLGQHALDQVHHHLQRVLLVALHHVEDERREHVEALAVAHLLVVARERQQHTLQQDAVLLVRLPVERRRRVARPVQVLNVNVYVYMCRCTVQVQYRVHVPPSIIAALIAYTLYGNNCLSTDRIQQQCTPLQW